MNKAFTAVATAAAIASPVAAAATTAPKKKVVVTTKTVQGVQAQADRWGAIQVTLVVKKTTTIVGKKSTVTRKITNVQVPIFPNHTDRSIFINQQAIPMLVQEVLQAQFTGNIDQIGGATATSYGFYQSLQAALLSAKKA